MANVTKSKQLAPRGEYKKEPWQDRFWSKVIKGTLDDHWSWIGSFFGNGYPAFWRDGKMEYAHHIMWELTHDEARDPTREIAHDCSLEWCIRDTHLIQKTHSENELDKLLTTHCKAGHEYKTVGYVRFNGGQRRCLVCNPHYRSRTYSRSTKVIYNGQ